MPDVLRDVAEVDRGTWVRRVLCLGTAMAMAATLLPATAMAQDPPPEVPAATLVFTTQPSDASGGTAFGVQPVVEVQDDAGATLDVATTVTLAIQPATGSGGATLTCEPVTSVAGVATFDGCSIDRAGTGYVLDAAAVGATVAGSAAFDVVAGPPASVVVVGQPDDISAGTPFSPAVAVELRDAGGNAVASAAHALGVVAVGSGGGPIPLSGCTGGTGVTEEGAEFYSVAPAAGATVATFADCTVDRAGTDYTLLAVAVPNDPGASALLVTSDPFDVATDQASQLVFTRQPGGAAAGVPLTRQPIVAVQDAQGNTVAIDADVSLRAVTPGVRVECPSPALVVDGIATFEGCVLESTGLTPGGSQPLPDSDFVLEAVLSPDGFVVASEPFGRDVEAASEAAEIAFLDEPSDGTAGTALAVQPSVSVETAAGTPGAGSVDLAIHQVATGTDLGCSNTTAMAIDGVAPFYGCRIDQPGTYRLDATLGGLTTTSDEFTVAIGEPVTIELSQSPAAAVAGEAFDLEAILRDAGGNQVESSDDLVRVALVPGDDGRTADIACDGGNSSSTTAGAAAFANCVVTTPGVYRVLVTSQVGMALGDAFAVMVGPPAAVTFLSAPVGALDGGLLATPVVLVEDAGGNPVDAQVSLQAAGGSLVGCDLSTLARRGVASFSGCFLDAGAGAITLTVRAGSAWAGVDVPVSDDAPVGAAVVAIPREQTFGGNLHAVNPTQVINDVNGATGALQFTVQDLTVAGIGVPFTLRRTYNSLDTTGGAFGPGWSSILDAGVTFEDGAAIVRAEDGQRIVFTEAAGCRSNCTDFVAPPGAQVDLDCKRTTCTVTRHQDGVSFTSEDGRITEYVARTGHGLSFDRDRRGDLVGITLTTSGAPLSVDVTMQDERVTELVTPTRTVAFAYDGAARLVSSTDPDGNVTSYVYDAGRLVGRALGAVELSVTYDGDGRVSTAGLTGQEVRHDDVYAYATDPDTGVFTTTRRSAVTAYGADVRAVHREHHVGNVLVWEQLPEGETLAYTYDDRGRWAAFQDGVGHVQRMRHDAAGNLQEIVAPDGGTTSFVHDDEHRVTRTTDQLGSSVEYHYSADVLRWVVPPDPASTSREPADREAFGTHLEYDDFGQVVRVRTPTSIQRIHRDEVGNEVGEQVYGPLDEAFLAPVNGNGTRLVHDEAGNIVSSATPRGHRDDGSVDPAFETTSAWDGNDRLVQMRTPQGDVTTYAYTPAGRVASLTRPETGTTTYSWDEATLTRTAAGAMTGQWTYDPSGNLVDRTDADQRRTRWEYDRSGRTIAEIDPTGFAARQVHDANAEVVRIVDRQGTQWTEYGYHGPVATTEDGATQTIRYDLAGNVAEVVDPSGSASAYAYDNLQNLASVATGVGVTSYTYDVVGDLRSMTDGVGNRTTYGYDPSSRRVSTTLDGSTWTQGYDLDGNLVEQVDPDGRTTSYAVDPLGQQIGIVHAQAGQPTIEITQAFDGQGRRIEMTDTTGTHTFTYDDDGRLTSAASPTGTFAYDYDEPGQRTDTYPDGTEVVYRYNDAGGVMGVEAEGVTVAYTRSADGRLAGIATGNGLYESYGHDAEGRLTSQRLACGTDVVSATRYGYDDQSRVLGTERTTPGSTTTSGFGYDAHDRLGANTLELTGTATLPGTPCRDAAVPPPPPHAIPPAPTNLPPAPGGILDPPAEPGMDGLVPATAHPVGYDAIGNRTAFDGTAYTYGGSGELLTGSDGRAATYDRAGNLTSSTVDGATTTYGYDAAGRLAEVNLPDGRTVSYTTDGDGIRVGKAIDGETAVTYQWDRRTDLPILVAEKLPEEDFRRYFYGVGLVAMQTPDGTHYLHGDGLTNVTGMTDDDGALVATYAYDAWGNVTEQGAPGAPAMPLRYGTNLLDDDTGLYHLRAREYDAAIGRFTQRDSVTPAVGVPVLSSYAYAKNLPTVFGDASGRYALGLRNVGYSGAESEAVVATRAGVAGGRFVGTKVLPKALMTKTAIRSAGWVISGKSGSGVVGAVAAADDVARFASKAAVGLAVVGIGLSVAQVALDCAYGTPYQCAGASISLAFNVGCLAASGGALTVLCSASGIGLTYVVANYGPDMVAASVDGYLATARAAGNPLSVSGVIGVSVAVVLGGACVVLTGGLATPLCLAGSAALGIYLWSVGAEIDTAVSAGFNDLADWVSTGFDDAIATIVAAGPAVEKLINLMADGFNQGADVVIAEFTALGYEIGDIATEVADAFASTPALAAELFTDLGYEIGEVAQAVDAAFADAAEWTEVALADALASAGYALDEIGSAFRDGFDTTTQEFAAIGLALNYEVDQIVAVLDAEFDAAVDDIVDFGRTIGDGFVSVAASLRGVYDLAATEIAVLLDEAGATVETVANAVNQAYSDVAGWSEQALGDALDAVGYSAQELARGLTAAFDSSVAAVADTLLALGHSVAVVTEAIAGAFDAAADELAQALVDLGVATELIADALAHTYDLAADAIADVLGDAGAALEDLGAFFGDVAGDIADAFDPSNWF